jgi:hypothetical protein
VTLEDAAHQEILGRCRAAGGSETGGILIGRYSDWRDRAIVIEATGPPGGSRRSRLAFWRGFRGLTTLLLSRWTEAGTHYLGEWHFHPFLPAHPSKTDIDQMRAFANDPAYRCPRPILVVVGGDPAAPSIEVAVIEPSGPTRLATLRDSDVAHEQR